MKKILTIILTTALLCPAAASAMTNRQFVEGCLKGKVQNKACRTMLGNYYAHLPVIDRVARQEGMDHLLMRSLIAYESLYKRTAGSHVGATGLTQVMPATAAGEYGLARHHLYHPETSVRAGAKYFMKQYRHFGGNVELALAAYNAGPARVKKAGNRIPKIRETQHYVRNIMDLWRDWKAKEKHPNTRQTAKAATLPAASRHAGVSLPSERTYGKYGKKAVAARAANSTRSQPVSANTSRHSVAENRFGTGSGFGGTKSMSRGGGNGIYSN